MSYVVLDLEFNGTYSKRYKRFVNEIIEFGAVKTDDELNVTDSFSMLIKPQIGKKLNPRVVELTHITQEELMSCDNTFEFVAKEFEKFIGDSTLLTWGKGDVLALMENYKYYFDSEKLVFLTKYCDLQLYCEKRLNMFDASKQMGLSACAELLSIEQEGLDLHRACTDARLSAECFKKLYDEKEFEKYVSDATSDEFYKRLTFKATYIQDLDDPAVDKSKMFFDCENCGTRAVRKTKWELKNRSFRAFFRCPQCGKKFMGRIAFKQKFDSVVVSKKIINIVKEKEKEQES